MTNHLAWIQRVPSGWSVKPLRAVSSYVVSNVDKIPVDGEQAVRLCNYSDVYNNQFITRQLDFMVGTATEDEIRRFGLLVDDVIITKDSESWDDIGIPALVVETADDLVCGYHLALLRPNEKALSGRFLLRCLQAKVLRLQLELAANGVTRFGLPKSEIGAMRLPVPPLRRQLAIADFLDRETTRLDALAAAKQRVLDLLAEKRRAIIAKAVTRGLDPEVNLRDSGVPWLGEIPAHWSAMRVRHLISSLEQGWSPEAENREPTLDEWGVLKLNAVSQGVFDQTAAKTLLARMEPRPDIEVHAGDVLITRANTPSLVGDACLVTDTRPKLMLCDLIYRLRVVSERVDARFLVSFLITAGRGHPEMTARGTSNSMVKLSQEHIKDWWTPVPPPDEQRAIVHYIARETAQLDAMRAATERTIALLQERRSALIAAAVTGQLDVGATG